MKNLLLAAFGIILCAGAPAVAEEHATAAAAAPSAQAITYTVLEEDARIPFGASQVDSYRVGRDGSLILRVGVNRWYRATLYAPCARDLRWENDIALVSGGGGNSIDRFSYAVVDHNRCQFRTLDRIEDPRAVERAADAAATAGESAGSDAG
ncbi:MAG: DUF6491 family protein [Caulobacterales bacterium]|jgi:hypothetical protein